MRKRRLKYLILHDARYTFAFGAILGVILAFIVHLIKSNPPFLESVWPAQIHSKSKEDLTYDDATYDFAYEHWLHDIFDAESCSIDPDEIRYTNSTVLKSPKCGRLTSEADVSPFKRDQEHFDPRSEATFLKNKIDVSCLIMSKDMIKSTAIRDTWGSACNDLKFISQKDLKIDKNHNSSILTENPVKVEVLPSNSEFALLCKGLRKIWAERKDDVQWILITLEDVFALPENLRYYVAPFDPKGTHYIGHAMKFWNIIYNWADAGYALSKGTLEKFVDKFPGEESCEAGGKYWKNSDWYLGKHLATLDIHPVDTRDHIGRGRFIGHSLKKLLFPGGVSFFERYWRDSLYLSPDGPHCCSNYAITFHLTTSITRVFQFYYLYYHLRAFSGGGIHGNEKAPLPKRPLKAPALTLDEKLKEQALDKIFLDKLLKRS